MPEEQKEKESKPEKEEISEDVRDVVLERLDVMSKNRRFFIGSNEKGFTKKELMEEVKKGNEIGRDVVEMEMSFLKALKDGTLLEELNQEVSQ